MPFILLQSLEGLIQSGETEKFLLALHLTAGAVFYMQSLWAGSESTSWRFQALPMTTALKWHFLCWKKDVNRTIRMHFHESGYLFVQVYDSDGVEKGTISCQEVSQPRGIVELLLSVLEKSVLV